MRNVRENTCYTRFHPYLSHTQSVRSKMLSEKKKKEEKTKRLRIFHRDEIHENDRCVIKFCSKLNKIVSLRRIFEYSCRISNRFEDRHTLFHNISKIFKTKKSQNSSNTTTRSFIPKNNHA